MVKNRPARDRLRSLLIENSLKLGDFRLTSGERSDYYVDTKPTTLDPEGSFLLSNEILDWVEAEGIEADAIGGMTLGADPIVCPVAALSYGSAQPLRAFIVRKEAKGHGTGRRIEGALAPRSRVIVVDDVVTTGGSTLRAIEAVEAEGHEVVAVICLIDREQGGREALGSYRFHALFVASELLEIARGAGAP